MNKLKLKYILLFVFISLVVVIAITTISNIRLNKLLELEKNLIDTTYKSIISEYTTHANILFENVINQDEVLKIFSNAESSPDISRKKLYEKLQPMYKNMETFKLRQLHFHLKNNDSFLRFHRPTKYGDDLSDFRKTVKYVNEKHLSIVGFEEGRIYNGYRFVYPLSYNNKYIGSVETSISMQSIVNSLKNLLNAEIDFILNKKIVMSKVFKSELTNYKNYEALPAYVVDKNIKNSKSINLLLQNNNNSVSTYINNTKKNEVVSFYENFNSKGYIVSLVPINKALSDKPIAYIITLREHSELFFLKMQKTVVMSFFILLIGLVLHYMYKSEKKNITIKMKNQDLRLSEKKFKKLFNLQKNIIVVTDGKNIKTANKAMYSFFGIEHLESFTKNNKDISDRFIKSDNYFSLDKVSEFSSWMEVIESLHGNKKIVAMYDKYNNQHTFNVSVNQYDTNNYIVLFTDISETMKEKIDLSNRIIKDTLTGALNREFFEVNIFSIIKNLKTNRYLGVTMLDIDFFKPVNDVYGHDAGDVVLKELTTLVKSIIREDDYFIRWGGEEFIILLDTSSIKALNKTIEHVREKIENTPFSTVGNVTCSFGTTLYNDGEDIKETIIRADKALYIAKENGRNKVVYL